MTYLGTRPPTLDEWNKYELHHRARLAIKPGITGMWQVSGRSEIRSFLTENQIKCDYAFFSGDLRNAPDHCFQKDSVKYLRELCEAVNVSPDHFFMVPGNHDVDREIEKRDQAVKRILDNHGSEKGYI